MRDRRAAVCEKFFQHPDMQRYKALWETIPWEVVSGDETDHYKGEVKYVRTSLPWRAKWIRQWMEIFERLHLATRFSESGRATPGAFPHIRVNSSRYREDQVFAQPVRHLPRSFYDPDWLSQQNEMLIHWLDIQPAVDLTFSVLLQRFSNFFFYSLS